MKTLAILLLTAAASAFAGPATPGESHKVLYLADSGIVVIQFSVQIEGAGPNQRFEAYVDGLLKELDKNSDGAVTMEEARGKVLTPREAQQLQLAPVETNPPDASPDISPKDGKLSRSELLAYYKRIGVFPFSVRIRQAIGDQGNAAGGMVASGGDAPLFQRLDANGDKKLSVEELTRALEVLRKLDRDNDETISAAELQPLANPQVAANRAMISPSAAPAVPFVSLATGESVQKLIRRVIEKYDSADAARAGTPSLATKNQKLSPLEIGWGESQFAPHDVDGDGQLDFAELRQCLASLPPTLELILNVTNGQVHAAENSADQVRLTADGAANLQFGSSQISVFAQPAAGKYDPQAAIKPLFMAFDADANGYLEQQEAQGNSLFGAAFSDVDRDKNGKLFLDEIVDYFKTRIDAANSRVELSIVEQGRTLFDILDSDRDGRLARREVRSVADKLALWDSDGDGQLSENEIPLQYRLVASQGSLPNFGLIQTAGMNPRQQGGARAAGPVWFRKMDRNSDGELSHREFLGDLDLFEQLDLNRDGAIELNEALRARLPD